MKKNSAIENYGPLGVLLMIILGGLYAGSRTGHYNNLIVAFAAVGLISLSLTKLLALLFKKLPEFFKPLYLVTQTCIGFSFFIFLLYLFK